ncbi:MAG TPA: hypothetical protein VKF79_07600 [Candidatus Acidoferrum sp.]|nr:hypothetical protein [Candidatus Acidoferrum sp.]
MTRYRPQPPWEFLLTASRNSLQSYELTRLSHAANLRKEIGTLMDQWLDENAAAIVARWLIEKQERPVHAADRPSSIDSKAGNSGSVSDNFFGDAALAPPINREVA